MRYQSLSPTRPSQRFADAALLVFITLVAPCVAALMAALYVAERLP